MGVLLQQLINGFFIGSVYGLFAVGYTLVFGVLDILNLAHAAIFTLGGLAALWLTTAAGLSIWIAFPLAALFSGTLGLVLDRVAFVPLRRRADSNLSRPYFQHRHGDHFRERCAGHLRGANSAISGRDFPESSLALRVG